MGDVFCDTTHSCNLTVSTGDGCYYDGDATVLFHDGTASVGMLSGFDNCVYGDLTMTGGTGKATMRGISGNGNVLAGDLICDSSGESDVQIMNGAYNHYSGKVVADTCHNAGACQYYIADIFTEGDCEVLGEITVSFAVR